MKKLFKTLFVVSFLGMALSACNNSALDGLLNYSSEWTYDAAAHWHACTDAGHEDAKDAVAAHTFDKGVVTPATFEADGYTTYTCTVCGYSYKDNYVKKTAHSYSTEWSVDAEHGTHYHACTDEGYTNLRSDEAEHDYDLGVITPATFEAPGYITYTCKVCGHKDIRAGEDQLEHHYSTEWSQSATTHWHACTDAGYENLKSGEANHDYQTTVIPATHEAPEYEIHECKVCGYSYTTEGGEPVEHHYSSEWSYSHAQHWHACTDAGYENLKKDTANHTYGDPVVVPATFEEQGYTRHTCTVCGYHYDDDYVDVLEHNYSSSWTHDVDKHWHACTDTGYESLKSDEGLHTWNTGEITTEPTETQPGVRTYTCTVCGRTKTDVVPPTTHHYSSEWSNNSTQHWHACTDDGCESVDELENHTYDAGVHTDATYEHDAYTTYTCTKCGYSYASIEENSKYEFSSESHFTYALNDNGSGWVITGTDSYFNGQTIYIPRTHTEEVLGESKTLPVVEIGEEAFIGSECFKLVTSDNLEKISKSAFAEAQFLHTVEIGKDVQTIQSNAFTNCYRMTEVFNQSLLNIKVGSSTYGGIARNALKVVTSADQRGTLSDFESNFYYYTAANNDKYVAYYVNPGDVKDNVNIANVVGIKAYAFQNVANVHGITIGDTITEIGHHAFVNSGLESVSIPETVTKVGDNAFENCASLASATVLNSTVGNYQFKGCANLASATAANATSIGNGAFEGAGISAFTVAESVTSIGASAFASTPLESINIPEAVTSIGEGAFYDCESLEELTVAAENTKYSAMYNVLYNKTMSELIVYPAGIAADVATNPAIPAIGGAHLFVVYPTVTTIDSNAFYKAKLQAITLPKSISSIGSTPFRLASNLGFILMYDADPNASDSNVVGDYYAVSDAVLYTKNFNTLIAYPAKLPTTMYQPAAPTRTIADSAFEGADSLEFLFLGSTSGDCVSKIGINAFAGCTHLYQLKMIAGGTNFGLNCFGTYDADPAKNTAIAVKTLDFMGTSASNFKLLNSGTSNLHLAGVDKVVCTDVAAGNTASYLLWNNGTEEYDIVNPFGFELPDGITTIVGQSYATTGIKSIVIPASVKTIEAQAFAQCASLETVTFESGSQLTSIGDQAFAMCPKLQSVNLGNCTKLNKIGKQAFAMCSNLPSITIPASVKSIEDQAFAQTVSMSSVSFAEGSQLEKIGDQAFAQTALLSVTIPASVKVIGEQAFAHLLVESDKLYSAGDVKAHENKLYTCTENTGVWEDDKWTLVYHAFSEESTYAVDAYVIHEAKLYKCTTAVTEAGAWDASKWHLESDDAYGEFSADQVYAVDDYALKDGDVYKCTVSNGDWDASKWHLNSEHILQSVTFEEGSQLCFIGKQAFGNNTELASIELPVNVTNYAKDTFPTFSNESKYSLYNFVEHDDKVYICTKAVDEAGDWDPANWTLVGVVGETNATINVLFVGEQAFGLCTSLQNVSTVGNGNLSIGTQVFGYCDHILIANFSSCASVSLGNQALAGCSALTYVVLPDTFSLAVAPFYGDLNLSNASDATMPIFVVGDPTTANNSIQTSLETTGQACAIIYMLDENDPTTVVYTIKGTLSFYKENASAEEIAYAEANGFTWWHYVNNVPTIWTTPAP